MSAYTDASLIMVPSGYKDGKLYSAKPTNGDGDFTFSRGSNLAATRVNSDGLIEKGRENLLLQSNQFDTTWGTGFSTLTSGQVGYDGTNDAWKIESTTIGGETRIRQSQTFTTGEVISLSVYMKKGNVNFGIVRTYAITGGGRAWFDLENGPSGFRYYVFCVWCTASFVGSRLCFISREVCEYIANQFIEVYKEYFL